MPRAELTLFAHVASRPDAEIDLAQAALLIAEDEYPGLDVAAYIDRLDAHGAAAQRALLEFDKPGDRRSSARLERVLDFVYRELGFAGNATDYYDPHNSWLNDVLDRKVGIPITLAVVLLEIFARAGVEAAGVSFPGHFLVRSPGESGPLFVDPFDGRILTRDGLRELHGRVAGEPSDPDPRLLEPAGKKQVLVRMLHNLRGIFAASGERARLRAVLERLEILTPSDDLRREIVSLGGESPVSTTKSRILN
ncbi:MAG TPA: transglutaminase-like domain-containing protein [Polyangia bacterium]|jgi:regulator of sirC expression with transglutaminase-like and TPR domain